MEETIIQPHRKLKLNIKELVRYRELLFYFAWRDIKVRYKQTFIGAGWAILQPLAGTIVFTLFFNRVAGIQTGSDSVPYAVFSYLGLMFWNLFNASLSKSSNSIIDNAGVITKVYFPRLIAPLSSGVLAFIDFCISAVFFMIILYIYKVTPSAEGIILMPLMIVIVMLAALGAGLFFSAVNVKYRDVRQALPFLIQILMFLTPVIYPITLVPDRYQWVLYLNPVCGAISLLRSELLGLGTVRPAYMLLSIASSIMIFVIGIYYFKFKERTFADII